MVWMLAPDTPALVPFLAVFLQPCEAFLTPGLIKGHLAELATAHGDCRPLVGYAIHDPGLEAQPRHDRHCAFLEPQAVPVTVMRHVVLAVDDVVLVGPAGEVSKVEVDELAAVLVVSDKARLAAEVLCEPDRRLVRPAQIPEGVDRPARVDRERPNA